MRSTIEDVCRYTSEMCSCSSHGGRICKVGKDTCVLSDIPTWTDEMSACVKNRFPSAAVSVHSAGGSITGFHVLIHLREPERVPTLVSVVMGMTIMAASAFVWCSLFSVNL